MTAFNGRGAHFPWSLTVLVLLTLLLNAATIFLLEPFAGKSLTPWYGGSPAVWNACMFVFQGAKIAPVPIFPSLPE